MKKTAKAKPVKKVVKKVATPAITFDGIVSRIEREKDTAVGNCRMTPTMKELASWIACQLNTNLSGFVKGAIVEKIERELKTKPSIMEGFPPW